MLNILTDQRKILIWENNNFTITTRLIPHVSKQDGGQLVVSPKREVSEIFELTEDEMLEFTMLIAICTKSLKNLLNDQGIEVPYTNNQDNGNWASLKGEQKRLHMHIYGRARNSGKQIFGLALNFPHPNTGFYNQHEPLNDQDILDLKTFIENNLKQGN